MRRFALCLILAPFIAILIVYGPLWPWIVMACLAMVTLAIVEIDEWRDHRHHDDELARRVRERA